ncbi:DUF3795 domain-containing protein [Candidatus Bipolaricaulota bacterium]|nr:DUF3795 domain-containing protein [Candidatus Bipolaricaulota bacterium]
MEKSTMIACCGLVCSECPAYLATQQGNHTALSKLAREWSTEEHPLSVEDCLCCGCKGEGLVASFVDQCEIRRCALGRSLETCGHCSDYPCRLLEPTFRRSPKAKAMLDEIAAGVLSRKQEATGE